MQKRQQLKKPFVLQIIIYSFLAAPIGNIIFTAVSMGIVDWYQPKVLLNILSNIGSVDYFWLGSIFFAGIMLNIRHRTAWIIAISSLSLTMLINMRNFYQMMSENSLSFSSNMQFALSLLTTIAVVSLFFHYRYPYLDRRSTLFGFARRVDVDLPCQIKVADMLIEARCLSLSISGARFAVPKSLSCLQLKKNEVVQVQIPELQLEIMAIVVEHETHVVRAQFTQLSSMQKLNLLRLVNETKKDPEVLKAAG